MVRGKTCFGESGPVHIMDKTVDQPPTNYRGYALWSVIFT